MRGLIGIFVVWVAFSAANPETVCGQHISPASDSPKPNPPEVSQKLFEVPDGFRVELVAAEPHLADPSTIAFDAHGRIYACEIHGYNLEGYFDVVELNKSGKLDRTVRRIPAPDWAIEKARKHQTGSVKLLVDTDGDGRVDRSSVFAKDLPSCYGITAARDGVIVLCAPHIYFLADRDGDGVAEFRETLFTGFHEGEQWSRTNQLVQGLDNWIYACAGRGPKKTITGPNLTKPVELGSSGYRFRADGSAIEPITGSAGGFGLGLSDWGDRMLIHNSTNGLQVVPIPYRYLTRNPDAPSPGSLHRAATYSELFPISKPHPWRAERGRHKAWRDFYGAGEAQPNGRFTAACSPTFYRGGGFPPEFHGNLFACDSQQNLINRAVPKRVGAKISLVRPRGFEKREFLASREGWFRPINLATGPDDALYIVDMYREIIEDYSAIPRYLQQQYGLEKGADLGRIWRVVHENAPERRPMVLADATDTALVETLSHRNAVWRTTAQRLLVERRAKGTRDETRDAIRALVRNGRTPQAKLHALYTLEGLDLLDARDLESALGDEHFAVRWNALQLADPFLDKSPSLLRKAASLVGDKNALVRLQLALTLGESRDPQAAGALASLAVRHGSEDWMRFAILSSSSRNPSTLLTELLRQSPADSRSDNLIRSLSESIGSRRLPREIEEVLDSMSTTRPSSTTDLRVIALEGLLRGFGSLRESRRPSQKAGLALSRLLATESPKMNEAAFRLAVAMGLGNLPAIERMFEAASARVGDRKLPIEDRLLAIDLLAGSPLAKLEPLTAGLLSPVEPIEIQLATVRALAPTGGQRVGKILLAHWTSSSPKVRSAILDAAFSREDRVEALLDSLESRSVPAEAIGSFRRSQLLSHRTEKVRSRAARLFVDTRPDATEREKTLARYRAALGSSSTEERGREIFRSSCADCHRAGDIGTDVGAPLAGALGRPDEALLLEILDPSSRIGSGFTPYTIVKTDGTLVSGLIRSESATSLEVVRAKGESSVVLRKDIARMTASRESLMPSGLEKDISPSQMSDLFAFLRATFGKARATSKVLFDDDATFVEDLTEGKGVAKIVESGAYFGKRFLSVTPPQRYSARIKDWSFRITETPKPGEFRYLRLAWAAPGAKGVMIELAADGRWPDSKSRERRIYAGENMTDWRARQVSKSAPRDWTVVTVDLWKDNGAFTLTGIAPTAMGGTAFFDRIELLATLEE